MLRYARAAVFTPLFVSFLILNFYARVYSVSYACFCSRADSVELAEGDTVALGGHRGV
jgi:hypothetical protein